MERAFQKWSLGKVVALRWIALAPGDDFVTLASRRNPPDIILGASGRTLRRLKTLDRLDGAGSPWWVARRLKIDAASASKSDDQAPDFDDFREDPVSLEWAVSILAKNGWAEGYGELVRKAGRNRPPGRQSMSSFAAFERGEADSALMLAPTEGQASSNRPNWYEGLAIVHKSSGLRLARDFVNELATSGEIAPASTEEIARSSGGETLLADLLGATLVDAQEDLLIASAVLKDAKTVERAEHWMEQAPPWPPASVAKLLTSENGMALVDTLASQIAPNPGTRSWLIRSWLSPTRSIDGPLLDELAAADHGRLLREPRFRNWLRSEWTAWARQRYRRVARLAVAGDAFP